MKQFKGPRRQGGWVQMALAGVGAISSIAGGISGRSAAKDAGRATARTIMETYSETQRRKDIRDQQKLGMTRASIAASGIQRSGTSAEYLSQMQDEIKNENAWLERAARMNARAARKGGQAQGDVAMYSGLTQGIQYAGQAAVAGYEWYTNRGEA